MTKQALRRELVKLESMLMRRTTQIRYCPNEYRAALDGMSRAIKRGDCKAAIRHSSIVNEFDHALRQAMRPHVNASIVKLQTEIETIKAAID